MYYYIKYITVVIPTLVLSFIPVHTASAITCPSVTQIKTGQLQGWVVYGQQGEQLTDDEITVFRKQVRSFRLAQWDHSVPDGPAQCFYVNKLESYLAHPKKSLCPDEQASKYYWIWQEPTVFARCTNTIRSCKFTMACPKKKL
jgi:hypothetical protein